jgi:hypothetical protein
MSASVYVVSTVKTTALSMKICVSNIYISIPATVSDSIGSRQAIPHAMQYTYHSK